MTTILLVEDDVTYRELLAKKLNAFFTDKLSKTTGADRIDLRVAGDETAAIECLQKDDIDLVMTGIRILKDGEQRLLSHLDEYHPEIPCIVITTRGDRELKTLPANLAVHFLEKPFTPADLGRKIFSLLGMDASETTSGISLANFLQILEMEEQSCIVKIETTRKQTGYFCFKDGKLYDAVFGEHRGEDAAIRMIPLRSNRIHIRDLPNPNPKKRISIDYLMPLIARALKMVKKKETPGNGA